LFDDEDDDNDGESLIFEEGGTVFLLNVVKRWISYMPSHSQKT
jgi:hypothetical protein